MTPLDAVPFHPLHQEALYLNIQQTLIPESCFASELGAKKRNLALKEQGSLTLGVFSPIASSFLGKKDRVVNPNVRRYGQSPSCTTCARSDSDGATRHNARRFRRGHTALLAERLEHEDIRRVNGDGLDAVQ